MARHIGVIVKAENGRISNDKALRLMFDSLPAGKQYSIEINDIDEVSDGYRGYYWKMVLPLVFQGLRDAGHDQYIHKIQVHEYLKGKFLPEFYFDLATGSIIEKPGSTAGMATSRYYEYVEMIKRWAAEYLQVFIPDPIKQTKSDDDKVHARKTSAEERSETRSTAKRPGARSATG